VIGGPVNVFAYNVTDGALSVLAYNVTYVVRFVYVYLLIT